MFLAGYNVAQHETNVSELKDGLPYSFRRISKIDVLKVTEGWPCRAPPPLTHNEGVVDTIYVSLIEISLFNNFYLVSFLFLKTFSKPTYTNGIVDEPPPPPKKEKQFLQLYKMTAPSFPVEGLEPGRKSDFFELLSEWIKFASNMTPDIRKAGFMPRNQSYNVINHQEMSS